VQKANAETNLPIQSLMEPQSRYVEAATTLSDIDALELQTSSEYEFRLREVAIRAGNEISRADILYDPSFEALSAGHAISQSRRSNQFGPFDGYVTDSLINALPLWETSANELESYAKCPYSYFLAHELRVEERIYPEESLTLSPLDKGILVHSILEQFLTQHGIDRSDKGKQALRDIANREFDWFQAEEFVGYNAIFNLEKVQILSNLMIWHSTHLDILDGYKIELITEQSFGYDDSMLGILRLDDGFKIRFRGRIDLIAVSSEPDLVSVFDFKTGRRSYYKIETDITDSGTKLQLPIYSIVASQILGKTNIEAAFWFVFTSGRTRLRPMKRVGLYEAAYRFQPVLTTIVEGIRAGIFPARPGDTARYADASAWNNCRSCPYDDVCTSDRQIAWDRKKSDPVLENYVALAED
jgi:RecB family exonuclease